MLYSEAVCYYLLMLFAVLLLSIPEGIEREKSFKETMKIVS